MKTTHLSIAPLPGNRSALRGVLRTNQNPDYSASVAPARLAPHRARRRPDSKFMRGANGLRLSFGGPGPLRSAAVRVFLGAVLSACLSFAAVAGVIYVVPGGSGGNTGADWANAKDLAPALAGASGAGAGSELWVKSGTYKPGTTGLADPRTGTFALKTEVALYGGFAGTETARTQRNSDPATNGTILTGDLAGNDGANFANNGENSYHVVTGDATDATAILDGFTVRGGNANGGGAVSAGGGMYTLSGNPTLTNVTFSRNSAWYGGGIYNDHSSPTLTTVTFSGNSAVGDGGGMYNYSTTRR